MAQKEITKTKPHDSHTDICEDCVVTLDDSSKQNLVDNGDGSSTLYCVKCPYCLKIVNAHMTKTSISCPDCKVTVNY